MEKNKDKKPLRQYLDTCDGYTIEEYRLILAMKYVDFKNYDIAKDIADRAIRGLNPKYPVDRVKQITALYNKVMKRLEEKRK